MNEIIGFVIVSFFVSKLIFLYLNAQPKQIFSRNNDERLIVKNKQIGFMWRHKFIGVCG